MRKQTLTALTGARFFAAFYVLSYHVFGADPPSLDLMVKAWPWPLANFLDRGSVAVNFFFVLSGFILAYNYSSVKGAMACSKHDFWIARFARIWPMFVVGLLIAIPLLVRAGLYEYKTVGQGPLQVLTTAFVHLLGNLVLINAWIPKLNDISAPGWSLSAEAFFYLVFPFVLRPLGQLSNRALCRVAACFYLLSLLPPLVFCLWVPCTANVFDLNDAQFSYWGMTTFLYLFPPFRLPDFLIGVVFGIIFNRTASEGRRLLAANTGIALAVYILALALTVNVPWPILRNGFYTPLSIWLIWSLARQQEGIIAKILAWSPIVLLGEASYGIYLFHLTIIRYLKITLFHFGYESSLSLPLLLFFITSVTVIPLSIWLFWMLEEPARKFLRKRLFTDWRGFRPKPQKTNPGLLDAMKGE